MADHEHQNSPVEYKTVQGASGRSFNPICNGLTHEFTK